MNHELLIIGHLNMDTIHTSEIDATESPGGGAMYTAFAASIYGNNVSLLSNRCSDLPQSIFDEMSAAHISTENVLHILGEQRRSSMSYAANFQRTNLAHNTDSWLSATIEQVPRHLPLVKKQYGFVYLAPLLATNQLRYAKWAKEHGASVGMDISEFYARQNLASLLECLQYVDIFLPSNVELNLMYPEYAGDVDRIAQVLAHTTNVSMLIVKCSTAGSRIYDFKRNRFVQVGIRAVSDAKDATGAGDTYNGGFLSCYLDTGDAVKSAKYAAVVASECIRDVSFRNLLGKTRAEIMEQAEKVDTFSFAHVVK